MPDTYLRETTLPKQVQHALARRGIYTLRQLTSYTEMDLRSMHRIGATSITCITKLLAEQSLSLKTQTNTPRKA